ncbi:hypothetical protein W03_19240 [Nitrosomonas sp. PY1]|nr:hypothetical protein W03_19240 [Nitrosomonas sp. PY1]
MGVVKLISFTVYNWIERMIGFLLITIPFILDFLTEAAVRNFYIAMGITIIVISLLTDYQSEVENRETEFT